MNTTQQLKPWLIMALLASLLLAMLIIVKHYNADDNLQQGICTHSEIKDTI